MRVLLLGAGKIGAMIAEFLIGTKDYHLTVGDLNTHQLAAMPTSPLIETRVLDVFHADSLLEVVQEHDAVISACPFQLTPAIATAACKGNAHYFDLTEDIESSQIIQQVAAQSSTAFVAQCGLAPGFVSIVANDLTKGFETLQKVHMRVGALPLYPSNALKYNLTWSTDGLINEYCNPCEAIVDGQRREMPALEELEEFSLDGVRYEAFNTSGGLGTLCDTLEGKVENLNYRTVRYPGHRDIMKVLLHDLRLGQRRELLKDVLEHALPMTLQDVVLLFVTVSGYKNGRFLQESYAQKIYSRELRGQHWSAIQMTTAAGVCALVDLVRENILPNRGIIRQEDVHLKDFLSNRFGKLFL